MFKLFVELGILIVFVTFESSATELTKNVEIKIVSPQEMKEILKQFPNAIQLQRKFHPTNFSKTTVYFDHYLGQRVEGDFNVAHTYQNLSWKKPTNVKMTIDYPRSGIGRNISYVEIFVEQTTSESYAYVTRGGIGQRFIRIIIEARKTHLFIEKSNIYGY